MISQCFYPNSVWILRDVIPQYFLVDDEHVFGVVPVGLGIDVAGDVVSHHVGEDAPPARRALTESNTTLLLIN